MSTNKKPQKGDQVEKKESLERHVHDAMRSLGWIIPTTEADVEHAEEELSKEKLELPDKLKDPYQILENFDADCPSLEPEQAEVDAEVEELLARAAREGAVIRPEVEERMRRDRQAAEQGTT